MHCRMQCQVPVALPYVKTELLKQANLLTRTDTL